MHVAIGIYRAQLPHTHLMSHGAIGDWLCAALLL